MVDISVLRRLAPAAQYEKISQALAKGALKPNQAKELGEQLNIPERMLTSLSASHLVACGYGNAAKGGADGQKSLPATSPLFVQHRGQGGDVPSNTLTHDLQLKNLGLSTEDEKKLEEQSQKLRAQVETLLGPPPWGDRVTIGVEKRDERMKLFLKTKGDLDLSQRGLNQTISDRMWRHHEGDLNLAGNILNNMRATPVTVSGDLNLSHNAFLKFYASIEARAVGGHLDLSHNRGLISLERLEDISVGGHIKLLGIPAKQAPHFRSAKNFDRGKNIFIVNASQRALAGNARVRGIDCEIANAAPPKKEFVAPNDPVEFLCDVHNAAQVEPTDLYTLVCTLSDEQKKQVHSKLVGLINPHSMQQNRDVLRILNRFPHELGNPLASWLEHIPKDLGKSLPASIRALPTPFLALMQRYSGRLDLENKSLRNRETSSTEYPEYAIARAPKERHITELFLERAALGDHVDVRETPATRWGFNLDFENTSHTRPLESYAALISQSVTAARLDKGALMLTLKGIDKEVLATDLIQDFHGEDYAYRVLERAAQRAPSNEAFWALYMWLVKNPAPNSYGQTDAIHINDRRIKAVREQIEVAQTPSAALSACFNAIRGLDRHSTLSSAHHAAATLQQHFDALSEIEVGAVLQDILSQDIQEMELHKDGAVRLTLLGTAIDAQRRVTGLRAQFARQDIFHGLTDVLFNRPEVGEDTQATFLDAFDAMPSASILQQQIHSVSGELSRIERGKKVLFKQIERMIASVNDPTSSSERRDIDAKVLQAFAKRWPADIGTKDAYATPITKCLQVYDSNRP